MPSDEPICDRSLEYASDAGNVDVAIRVWRPVPDQKQPDDLCWCRFEVAGLPEKIEGNAAGIDTMQALICALQGIRNKLQPFATRLVFLDGPYEDFAEILIGVIDPGRRRRIIEILAEEEYALQVLFEQRNAARLLLASKAEALPARDKDE